MKLTNLVEQSSWSVQQNTPPEPLYMIHKDFPFSGDTVDVLVFIYAKTNQYEITSSVEARSSGPYNYNNGYTATLDEAIQIAILVCQRFDKQYKLPTTE